MGPEIVTLCAGIGVRVKSRKRTILKHQRVWFDDRSVHGKGASNGALARLATAQQQHSWVIGSEYFLLPGIRLQASLLHQQYRIECSREVS